MNEILTGNSLQELACGTNLMYVLSDELHVLPTEYKVMQNQDVNCLVRCMRMRYNGQDALYYLTSGLKPFVTVFLSSNADYAANLIIALLKSVQELNSIGFLSMAKIQSALHKIYVDAGTGKVSLIYLPIDRQFSPDEATVENELRSNLVRRIDELLLSSTRLSRLRQQLIDGTKSIMEIVSGTAAVRTPPVPPKPKGDYFSNPNLDAGGNLKVNFGGSKRVRPLLVLTSMNPANPLTIRVTKDEFRLGKSPEADGQIPFNKFIGRIHCKLQYNGREFHVIDLESKNGTYVKGIRLLPNQPYPVKNGDVLRLANSEFQISIQSKEERW